MIEDSEKDINSGGWPLPVYIIVLAIVAFVITITLMELME